MVCRAAATTTISRKSVPLELEEGEMPLNTYNNKKPFIAKVKSVERIVGPKATGETCHIIIETDGKIPFWEGQSYGVIPPVRGGGGPPSAFFRVHGARLVAACTTPSQLRPCR